MANVRRGWIKIRFSMDRFGGITAYIVSRELERRARQYLRGMAECGAQDPGEGGGICYYQDSSDLPEEISPRMRRDLVAGWDVTVLMDPWVVGQGMLGYDAGDGAWWAPTPH